MRDGPNFDMTANEILLWKQTEEQRQAKLRTKVLKTARKLLTQIEHNQIKHTRRLAWTLEHLIECVENSESFVHEGKLTVLGWAFVCKSLYANQRIAAFAHKHRSQSARSYLYFSQHLSAYTATYLQLS